jgi:hypothetical protein
LNVFIPRKPVMTTNHAPLILAIKDSDVLIPLISMSVLTTQFATLMMIANIGLNKKTLITNARKHIVTSIKESVYQRLQPTNNVISLNAIKLANQDLHVKPPNVFLPTMMVQRHIALELLSFAMTKKNALKIHVMIPLDASSNTDPIEYVYQEHNVHTMQIVWILNKRTIWHNNALKLFANLPWVLVLKFQLTKPAKKREEIAKLTVLKMMLVMLLYVF